MQKDECSVLEEALLGAMDRLSIPISLLKLKNGYAWFIWPLKKHGSAFSLSDALHDAVEVLIDNASTIK